MSDYTDEDVERWLPVVGADGECQVSDRGRVRDRSGKIIRQWLDDRGAGYFAVSLRRDGKSKRFQVASLVMAAFVGPRPDKLACAHLNGKSTDNRLENLAYVTYAENSYHQKLHGTVARGSRHGNAKINEADVVKLREMRAGGLSYSKLSEHFGLNKYQVWCIARGTAWAHVPLPAPPLRDRHT